MPHLLDWLMTVSGRPPSSNPSPSSCDDQIWPQATITSMSSFRLICYSGGLTRYTRSASPKSFWLCIDVELWSIGSLLKITEPMSSLDFSTPFLSNLAPGNNNEHVFLWTNFSWWELYAKICTLRATTFSNPIWISSYKESNLSLRSQRGKSSSGSGIKIPKVWVVQLSQNHTSLVNFRWANARVGGVNQLRSEHPELQRY